jgi:hypothetical protein
MFIVILSFLSANCLLDSSSHTNVKLCKWEVVPKPKWWETLSVNLKLVVQPFCHALFAFAAKIIANLRMEHDLTLVQ